MHAANLAGQIVRSRSPVDPDSFRQSSASFQQIRQAPGTAVTEASRYARPPEIGVDQQYLVLIHRKRSSHCKTERRLALAGDGGGNKDDFASQSEHLLRRQTYLSLV